MTTIQNSANPQPKSNAQLDDADLARVNTYLNRSIHQVERKPFRFWRLLLIIMLSMGLLSLISFLLAELHHSGAL